MLVNPAAAQLMGYRASALGGRELHALVLHTGGDGEPVPFEESPLADTLRTGRRHRVQGQVLWARDGDRLVVDMTIAPVCAGERVVGAVVTFVDRGPDRRLAHRHAAEVTAQAERHGAELRRLEQRYEELAGRHRLLAGPWPVPGVDIWRSCVRSWWRWRPMTPAISGRRRGGCWGGWRPGTRGWPLCSTTYSTSS